MSNMNCVRTVAGERSPTVARRETLPPPQSGSHYEHPLHEPPVPLQGDVTMDGDVQLDLASTTNMATTGTVPAAAATRATRAIRAPAAAATTAAAVVPEGYGPFWPDPWEPEPVLRVRRGRISPFRLPPRGPLLAELLGTRSSASGRSSSDEGFKGPMDQGVNGNFGFNEGFNAAGPVVPFPRIRRGLPGRPALDAERSFGQRV